MNKTSTSTPKLSKPASNRSIVLKGGKGEDFVTFAHCSYCERMRRFGGKTHEDELLRKADILCVNPANHFRHWVNAELDYANHARLSPTGQVAFLAAIHAKSGCTCRDGEETDNRPTNHDSTQTHPSPTFPESAVTGSPKGPNPLALAKRLQALKRA